VLTYPFQFIEVQIPQGKKVTAAQFVTGKGQAIANIVADVHATP
jgi:hypothetical protein